MNIKVLGTFFAEESGLKIETDDLLSLMLHHSRKRKRVQKNSHRPSSSKESSDYDFLFVASLNDDVIIFRKLRVQPALIKGVWDVK
jgi:hypothetical protein